MSFHNTKKYKHWYQFKCHVVRVIAIDPFKSARSLLYIVGGRGSEVLIGHAVAYREISEPLDSFAFTGVPKKSILHR